MKKSFNIGCLVKVLALAAIVALVGFIYVSCSGQGCKRIDKTEPDKVVASYLVTTKTHSYYAATATQNQNGSVTMANWYERLDKRWVLHTGEETLPALFHPKVERR